MLWILAGLVQLLPLALIASQAHARGGRKFVRVLVAGGVIYAVFIVGLALWFALGRSVELPSNEQAFFPQSDYATTLPPVDDAPGAASPHSPPEPPPGALMARNKRQSITVDVVSFDFEPLGVVLPDRFVVSVAYNTSVRGYQPIGEHGPWDSLNVGTTPAPNDGPVAGPEPGEYLISWKMFDPPGDVIGDPGMGRWSDLQVRIVAGGEVIYDAIGQDPEDSSRRTSLAFASQQIDEFGQVILLDADAPRRLERIDIAMHAYRDLGEPVKAFEHPVTVHLYVDDATPGTYSEQRKVLDHGAPPTRLTGADGEPASVTEVKTFADRTHLTGAALNESPGPGG